MKITCLSEKIKSKVVLAGKATSRNLSLPILSTILFDVRNNKTTIKATNLDIGVEFIIPSKIEKEGVCAVSGVLLSNILSTFQNEEIITLELVENNLSIKSKNNISLIKTQPYDEFPNIPRVKGVEYKHQINLFLEGLKTVTFSTATNDIKPEIASVYVYTEGGYTFFVSTDSFRLSEKKTPIKGLNIDHILIPNKNTTDIIRFFDTNTDTDMVTFLFDKNQLSIQSDSIYFTTRLTNGVYPDYRQLIPKEFSTQVIILKSELIDALRLAHIFSDDFHRILFRVSKTGGGVEIESKNTQVGENTTKIEAHIEGNDLEMSFNHRYISEVLQVIPTDSISFKFNQTNRPLVVSGVGDESFKYLVMPVNR